MQPARGVLLDQIGVAALGGFRRALGLGGLREIPLLPIDLQRHQPAFRCRALVSVLRLPPEVDLGLAASRFGAALVFFTPALSRSASRSEEHTSELQSLMRISYAVFCLKKKTKQTHIHTTITSNHNTH